MTVQVTSFPDHHVTLHHNAEAQPEPKCMVWFLHGVPATVFRNAGETSEALWLRTLAAIHDERLRLTRTRSLLDPLSPCDVYGGELAPECLAKLEKRYMRQHILSALARESAAPPSTGATGGSRTRALTLLAKLTGTTRPRRKITRTEHLPNE